jgi:hypothetical protein
MKLVAPLISGRIHDVAVPGYPAWISRTPPAIFFFQVKNVLQGGGNVDHVTAVSVDDPFGFSGRARSVQG